MKNLTKSNKTKNEQLVTPQQLQAICLLMEGASHLAVAQAIGVTRQTVWRWMLDEHFKRELERYKDAMFSEARGQIFASVQKAVNVLVVALDDEKPSVRISAASRLLAITGDSFLKEKPPYPLQPKLEQPKNADESFELLERLIPGYRRAVSVSNVCI